MNRSPHSSWRRGLAACALLTPLLACTSTGPLTPSPDPAQNPRARGAEPAVAAGPLAELAGDKTHAEGNRETSKLSGIDTHRDKAKAAAPSGPLPTERELLKVSDNAMAHVYPPMAAAAVPGVGAPVAVMLHGMCGMPLNACNRWRDTPQQHAWLLCPSGNDRCGNRFDWSGDGEEKAEHIDEAVTALRKRHGGHVATAGGDVLMGFSRGAFVARDVAYARPGRYRGLVLIGAALKPSAERLRRSGIRRVVLASGDLDGARPTMQLAAGLLRRDGMPARFVSLGRVWHTLPQDLHERLREPLAWVAAAPEEDDDQP